MNRARLAAAVMLMALAAGGCANAAAPVTTSQPNAAQPAANEPSASARMVCAPEAQNDIAEATGVTAVRVETPTWNDHVYACRYQYTGGSLSMSVKELASAAETASYFDGLGRQLGDVQRLDGLGEGAFITSNGSVVVRKDWKVLLVDDSSLPSQLGSPPLTPANVALIVAKTILGCWTGA
ncbi:hypothetical protein [Pseudonocardia acidicola]|uniref:DUF3558 domain-containing protein n=1 Tax=Pseudonocardia acidicola TaxID=2724939 RepID=A0ABX1S9H4_9PSEU|nr:hypothetical protein [Pseudonocardia acidicola]NMH97755.1 hypothetical protein [Pseudonocardia acidicola]